MSTISAILAALPKILQLVNLIMTMVSAREQRGLGRAEAISEVLTKAHEEIARADAAENEARARHAANADDSAFDRDFQRDD